MQFQRYVTKDGFPGVTWEQEVPSGETEYSRTQEITWKLALLAGLLAFGAALGAGQALGPALGIGVAVGLVLAAADGLRSMKFNIQGTTIGGFEKTQAEREAEQRWKVTRLYRRERRWAEVHLEPQSKALFFILMQGVDERTAQVLYEVPLLSFDEMELCDRPGMVRRHRRAGAFAAAPAWLLLGDRGAGRRAWRAADRALGPRPRRAWRTCIRVLPQRASSPPASGANCWPRPRRWLRSFEASASGVLEMRWLRGPYFVVACLLAVAVGVVLGGGWFHRLWVAVEAVSYQQPPGITGGVEPIFLRMDAALVSALAPHSPVCSGPGSVCTAKSERFLNFVSYRRAGNFAIGFIVGGQTNTTAQFDLSIDFKSADGRLTLNDQERQSLLQIARDYGFNESQQAAMLAACQEPPTKIATEKTVEAGGINFTCTVLPVSGDN